jgi:hypothetical protein
VLLTVDKLFLVWDFFTLAWRETWQKTPLAPSSSAAQSLHVAQAIAFVIVDFDDGFTLGIFLISVRVLGCSPGRATRASQSHDKISSTESPRPKMLLQNLNQ